MLNSYFSTLIDSVKPADGSVEYYLESGKITGTFHLELTRILREAYIKGRDSSKED